MTDDLRTRQTLPEGRDDWSALLEIGKWDESPKLRWLFRAPNEPESQADLQEAQNRAETLHRVDAALNRLVLYEIAFETGLIEKQDQDWKLQEIRSTSGLLQLLEKSHAFSRHLDTHLYFGVRFLASRMAVAASDEPLRDIQINDDQLTLPTPPRVPPSETIDTIPELFYESQRGLSDPDAERGVMNALRFLDPMEWSNPGEAGRQPGVFENHSHEVAAFERWLRDLPSGSPNAEHFDRFSSRILEFARAKCKFYIALEEIGAKQRHSEALLKDHLTKEKWYASEPLVARFGLADLYWLARLLRAEVSSAGVVTYASVSWLGLLAERARRVAEAAASSSEDPRDLAILLLRKRRYALEREAICKYEVVLRAVLDYTLELVHNSIHIAREEQLKAKDPDNAPDFPKDVVPWHTAYDEELDEINKQRIRAGRTPEPEQRNVQPTKQDREPSDDDLRWSKRVRTGEHVDNLVGLAFSGGGIRSATFGLGVLQGLQELDILREVDYLSTVSGGGYAGAWLLGNVRRTHYWLSPKTDWEPSIKHLRKYSNYLSPELGLMSADTWTMLGIWLRNAVLLQLLAVAWLSVAMMAEQCGMYLFEWAGHIQTVPAWVPLIRTWHPTVMYLLLLVIAAVIICMNMRLSKRFTKEWWVLRFAVLPAWLASFILAAVLWADRNQSAPELFSKILTSAVSEWWGQLVVLVCTFFAATICSLEWDEDLTLEDRERSIVKSLGFALCSTAVAYLGFCAVRWLFAGRSGVTGPYEWYAYVFGSSLVLLSNTVGILILIGLIGRDSPDWRREWWTRFGSWLGMFGIWFLVLGVASIFGPKWIIQAAGSDEWRTLKWGSVIGWVGTVIGGLISGGSGKTKGDGEKSVTAIALSVLAKVAAVMFIVGGALLVSTGLHAFMVEAWTSYGTIRGDGYWLNLLIFRQPYAKLSVTPNVITLAGLLAIALLLYWRIDINIFSLNQFYRNRLVRCYLGATRWMPGLRQPNKFTGFDEADDLKLSQFRNDDTSTGKTARKDIPYRGPFPVVNCSLNLGGSSDLTLHTRHSASFTLTPLRCGAERVKVGYRKTLDKRSGEEFAGGVTLGQAIAISGAAASPNSGYHTSVLVAFMLTMFNVRLGWWFPNPSLKNDKWKKKRLPGVYLGAETLGLADETSGFVNVSDGGHFENLGIYELVRRRCKVIIIADGECDSSLTFESLGSVVRMCEVDFGVKIKIDVESIHKDSVTGLSRAHCAVGKIEYASGSIGYLVYLKSSITGDEDIGVEQYRAAHPDFPHESTGDQFFAEDQFEAYRRLGRHVTTVAFRGVRTEPNAVAKAAKLVDLWLPAAATIEAFLAQTAAFDTLMERFRKSPGLEPLLKEISANVTPPGAPETPNSEEFCACMELLQLMENVFVALKLDDYWEHPDHRGWALMFMAWVKSPKFQAVWLKSRHVYGIRFEYFCADRLGLPAGRPPLRVS